MLKVRGLNRYRILLFMFAFMFIFSFSAVATVSANVIVVGKIADDGTMMLLWYSEGSNQLVVNDYDLVGVDDLTLSLYAPNKRGTDINITIETYIPIINRTTGEEIGRLKYHKDNITVSIPRTYTMVNIQIKLKTSNTTEVVIISYRNVNFKFYHKTKAQLLPMQMTMGQYYANIGFFVVLTGLTAYFASKTSKEILNRVKYFPKLDSWKIFLLLLVIGGITFGVYLVAFEFVYTTQLAWLFAILFVLLTLLNLQIFTPLPQVWLLMWLPRQDPYSRTLKMGIVQTYVDKVADKFVKINIKSLKEFILRLLGKYQYITIKGYPIPVQETTNSFDRVLLLEKEPQVTSYKFNFDALTKPLLFTAIILVFLFALFSINTLYGAVALTIITILFMILFLFKREVIKQVASKIADKPFIEEGQIELESAYESVIDIVAWLFRLIEVSDIAKAKDLIKQKYLKLLSRFDLETDNKASQIFNIVKQTEDNMLGIRIQPKETKVSEPKKEEVTKLEEQEEQQSGDENNE
ncbi:MAG: hypothetical protein J7L47_05000 [Candidatus Odinarchaeota archaeon]|nr:hypothetical protein [Candidatus Odinarchaeota archaeon]